jgi:hypothetical protein
MKILGIQFGRTEEEKWAQVKLDPTHNARAGAGKLTDAQIIARQQRAQNARARRRAK